MEIIKKRKIEIEINDSIIFKIQIDSIIFKILLTFTDTKIRITFHKTKVIAATDVNGKFNSIR